MPGFACSKRWQWAWVSPGGPGWRQEGNTHAQPRLYVQLPSQQSWADEGSFAISLTPSSSLDEIHNLEGILYLNVPANTQNNQTPRGYGLQHLLLSSLFTYPGSIHSP